MTKLVSGLLVLTALAVGACNSTPAEAPAPAPAPAVAPVVDYTPAVPLVEMMVYVVDTHANEIWDAAMTPPKTDAQWKALNRAAVVLAASGSLTKLSGNGADDQKWTAQGDWIRHSQALSDAGATVVKAVQAKDPAALSTAGDALVVSCINCHREYKLEVPSLWTERQLPPEEQKK
ncbi:MAG: cytochrome c [Vicinamibacterales bacterium]